MWFWKRSSFGDDFPKGFSVQRIRVGDALVLADLPPERIAAAFRKYPERAQKLLLESLDKRYSPSTFIIEQNDGYLVGWYARGTGYENQRNFTNLADAATDYLLFSLGKRPWTEPPTLN